MSTNSSLDLLIDLSQSEREAQLSHFDALDTEAGLVLGFGGVLIALGLDTVTPLNAVSTGAAAIAAVLSVASFWPRDFPAIDPVRLGDYAVSELGFAKLTVLDTLEVMLIEAQQMLALKSLRLKWALVALTTGVVLAAINGLLQ